MRSVNGIIQSFKNMGVLGMALAVSVALHAAVLLVRIADPANIERWLEDTPLEVILVNAQSKQAPEKAQAIAQHNLEGGGDDERQNIFASSPAPNSALTEWGEDAENQERQTQTLLQEQIQILTAAKRELDAMHRYTQQEVQKQQEAQKQQEQSNALAKALAEQMKAQIQDGAIEVEALGQQIIIRIREKAAFPAGSAFLQPQFWPVIRKVASLLKDVPGEITVSGHTDNIATENELFQSNWDLSSPRAVAVAHQMIKVPGFDGKRLVVQGMADSQPLVPNTNPDNRRMNRRVEISIMQGKPTVSAPIGVSDPK